MLSFLVHRPIAVLMSCFGAVMLGILVAGTLPVSLLPDIPIPAISVQISYPDVGPRQLENIVVKPLRNQLLQVSRLRDIRSEARNGNATIELDFQFGVNTDLAFIEVNEKIDQVISYLPKALERPRVIKANASDIPVFHLSVIPNTWEGLSSQARNQSLLELSEFSQTVLKRRIEQLTQVAFADLSGTVQPEIQIIPKQELMHSSGIRIEDIQQALQSNNLDLGSILVQDGHYQFNVQFSSTLQRVSDIENIYLNRKEDLLQLKDIAAVRLQPRKRQGKYLLNDKEGVIITVRKQADARLFALEESFTQLLESFRTDYPQLDFAVTNDQTRFLRLSIENLTSSLLYGACFAFLIMFLFFLEWRAPFMICLSIPIALILSALGFYLAGISINTISLAGLILGVGLMIDNAIIVIDNIRQQRQLGLPLSAACIRGGNEVIRPLISSALTTCSVFVPLVFLSGITGALFYDQAVSISIALGGSLLVSFVLLPTLSRIILRKQNVKTISQEEWIAASGRTFYARSVDIFLRHRWLVFIIYLALLIAGYHCIQQMPRQAFPAMSRDGLDIAIDWNEPLNLAENEQRQQQFLHDFRQQFETASLFIGEQQFLLDDQPQLNNETRILLYRNDAIDLAVLQDEVREYLNARYPIALTDVRPIRNLFDEIFSNDDLPLVAHLQSAADRSVPDLSTLQPLLNELPPSILLPPRQEQISIYIDREQANLYQVDYTAIFNSLKTLLNNNEVTALKSSNQLIPVVVGMPASSLFSVIDEAMVSNQDQKPVPLKHFIRVERTENIKTISAGRAGESFNIGFPEFSSVWIKELRQKLQHYPSINAYFSGRVFEDQKLLQELTMVLLIAVVLLYLILAIQFESLLQPLIVILIIPLGFAGSSVTLYWAGESLNIIALIGMVVMGGIIVNDAILKIDMMNRLSGKYSVHQAIHGGGRRRLRPIIMTSLTTILALTPILFSAGLGAELQRPLAFAVIGGLSVGTLASLYVIPVLYRLVRR